MIPRKQNSGKENIRMLREMFFSKPIVFAAMLFALNACAPVGGTISQPLSGSWAEKNHLMLNDMDLNINKFAISPFPRAGCKKIANTTISKIDWSEAPHITTVIRAGDFVPMVIRIKQGRPYVLRVRNRDEKVRYFRALDFFRRNAIIAITVDGEKAGRTCVHAIYVPPRKSAEIRFVSIEDGHYEFEDNSSIIPMVMSAGPSGVIIIEERKDAISQE